MLNNLPVQYRRDPWLIVLAAALQVPMDRQGEVIRSLPNQISLDRVTWNLPVEERVAGIVPPAGATVEQRRAALRAKWRSSGKATLAQIQAVAESWESQRVETSFLAGVIGIDIINLRQGTVAEIREAVEKIKPAHLPLEITERQYVETPILVGALARQGDSMILWEVDCRNDP
ncbi:putative phage tail protein [Clostridium phoceensis]|uniref:putative phage tail protein n=1 Tax=Clostridium phoceensis TaxID=1650661 RepID=UPI0023F1691E|nr:putative phage tail protein [Clostridium phoceensis]